MCYRIHLGLFSSAQQLSLLQLIWQLFGSQYHKFSWRAFLFSNKYRISDKSRRIIKNCSRTTKMIVEEQFQRVFVPGNFLGGSFPLLVGPQSYPCAWPPSKMSWIRELLIMDWRISIFVVSDQMKEQTKLVLHKVSNHIAHCLWWMIILQELRVNHVLTLNWYSDFL